MLLHIIIFIFSFAILFWSSKFLVDVLIRVSKLLGWKEFVVSFLIMAFATTIPNFFVGITSALKRVPELSFGDVVGTNIATLTLVVALSALVSKMGLSVSSRTVQGSSLFTIGVAILPLILIQDGTLSRIDGVVLLAAFIIYLSWLFNKRERFEKIYDGALEPLSSKSFFKNTSLLFCSILTGRKITRKEAVFLLGIYITFVLVEILTKF